MPGQEHNGVPFPCIGNCGVVVWYAAQRVGPKVDLEDSTLAPMAGDACNVTVLSLVPAVSRRENRMIAFKASHGDKTHAFPSIPGFGPGQLDSDFCSVVSGFQGQPVADQGSVVSTRPCTPPIVVKLQSQCDFPHKSQSGVKLQSQCDFPP